MRCSESSFVHGGAFVGSVCDAAAALWRSSSALRIASAELGEITTPLPKKGHDRLFVTVDKCSVADSTGGCMFAAFISKAVCASFVAPRLLLLAASGSAGREVPGQAGVGAVQKLKLSMKPGGISTRAVAAACPPWLNE